MKRITQIIAAQLVVCLLGPAENWAACSTPSGYSCVQNSGGTKQVCATRSTGAPAMPTDVVIDYSCGGCSDSPHVEVKTPDTGWEIFSEVCDTNAEADLGDVTLPDDVDPDAGIFGVAIKRSSGYAAASVGSISLDSSDASWSGHSSFTGIVASGDVDSITVVPNGTSGGVLSGTQIVSGAVEAITAYKVTGILSLGGLGNAGVGGLTVNRVESGASISIGSLEAAIDISEKLIGSVTVAVVPHSPAVTIADMDGTATLTIPTSGTYYYNGTLALENGIDDADSTVTVLYHGGTIDLNNGDVVGALTISSDVPAAEIINGDAVSGTVTLGNLATTCFNHFRGSAEFASVTSTGSIITDNNVHFQGNLSISGDMAGLIDMATNVEPFTCLPGCSCDSCSPCGDGLISIGEDLTGIVSVGGDFSGDITVGGGMTGTARITVDGASDGDIVVAENTTQNTRIHCAGGVESGGTIVLNDSEGNFSVVGSIVVGSLTGDAVPADNDGSIIIKDNASSSCGGSGGDLDGRIRIAVCDDDSNDHEICIDGDVNGTIDIIEDYDGGLCANNGLDHDCSAGCQ